MPTGLIVTSAFTDIALNPKRQTLIPPGSRNACMQQAVIPQQRALQQLSFELQSLRAMASSSVPFRVGALAELLVDDYARLRFARGSHVQVLEIFPGGPIEGGCRCRRQRHCRLPGKGQTCGPCQHALLRSCTHHWRGRCQDQPLLALPA